MLRAKTRALRALVPLALLLPVLSGTSASAPADCGPTTLQGTVVANEDGVLQCGPGEPLVVREDLGTAGPDREDRRRPLTAFFSMADFQLADEESPLRGEWADKCGDQPASSAFRPHETLVPHMMNAHVRAANRIARLGSPVLGLPFSFTVALGDLADNQHYNETRAFIDILDGGQLVDTDSGADGYDGVQADDPQGADPQVESPVENVSILDLANEPFWAAGLRNPDGSHLPWYSVLGNHDMKVQGTIPDDNPVWREFVREWAVGMIKVMDVPPDKQQEACEAFTDPEKFMDLLTDPAVLLAGTTKIVPADPNRRLLDKAEWIAEHSVTTGVPVGHGFVPEERMCPNESFPDYARRGCYWWIQDPFHFIVLDTTAAEGIHTGNIDDDQFLWLEDQLQKSSTSYFDAAGNLVENPEGRDRLIVILQHHTISSTTNIGPPTGAEPGTPTTIHDGEDLKALLLRFPNVILENAGHTHQNKIWAHVDEDKATGYWEINTSAVVDYPHQSRTIEIADNGDGTLSIFTVVFDAAVNPNPRLIDWSEDDPSEELLGAEGEQLSTAGLGEATRNINEDWLASLGMEVGFHDPQRSQTSPGDAVDRNVELLLGAPFDLSGAPPPTAETGSSEILLVLAGGGLLVLGLALMLALRRRPASSS